MTLSSTLNQVSSDSASMKKKATPDQQRLITEIQDWCSTITHLVEGAGRQLTEEAMSSSSPRMMKFVRSEYCAVLDKTKIGSFCVAESPPAEEPREVKELTVIQEEEAEDTRFSVGCNVIAKWSDDGIWYNARIEEIKDGEYSVLFLDYGNSDIVGAGDLVLQVEDVPAGDSLDECVVPAVGKKEKRRKFAVGQEVIAKWSEDNVWYNAKILTVKEDVFQVVFTDYENEEEVVENNIVLCGADIPAEEEDFVDQYVDVKGKAKEAKTVEGEDVTRPVKEVGKAGDGQHVQEKVSVVEVKNTEPRKKEVAGLPELSANTDCFAKWSEDDVWYNAMLDAVEADGYRVTFVNYGNCDVVPRSRIVLSWHDIPEDDDVDEFVTIPVKSQVKISKDSKKDKNTKTPENTQKLPKESAPIKSEKKDAPIKVKNDAPVKPQKEDAPIKSQKETAPIKPQKKDAPIEVKKDARVKPQKKDASIEPREKSQEVSAEKKEEAALVVGQSCLAKWDEDDVWYRAEVTKSTEAGVEVLFTDYGNSAVLPCQRILLGFQDIPAEDVANNMIDEHVTAPAPSEAATSVRQPPSTEEVSTPSVLPDTRSVGAVCVARWSDGVWYNAEITALSQTSATVTFIDYGNEDEVQLGDIVTDRSKIPPGQEEFIDENVVEQAGSGVQESVEVEAKEKVTARPSDLGGETLSSTDSSGIGESINTTSFFSFTEKDGAERRLWMKKRFVYGVTSPTGVTVLPGGAVAIVNRKENCVKVYNREGVPLPSPFRGHRGFDKPTDILKLSSGKIAVRDQEGIQLFSEEGDFIRHVGSEHQNKYFGLAEDDKGNIITINDCSKAAGPGSMTAPGQTDVFYFNEDNLLVKHVQMVDIINAAVEQIEKEEEKVSRSLLRHLGFSKGKLYVVDSGLNRVFIIMEDEEANVFGEEGDKLGALSNPTQIAFDAKGNVIIADLKNNRLQLVDENGNFYPVKADRPMLKPAGIYYDEDRSELLVSNLGENTVVCYKLIENPS